MKPGRFIFLIVILLSYSLNGTGAPVKTDNAQPTLNDDEPWTNSYLPSGVTMKEIREWEAGMTDNRKIKYQDALEREIKFRSEGKQMTAQELLALRIVCRGNRFRRYHSPIHNPNADEADLNKIFHPGLTKEENEKNAQLFETLDDGNEPAEEQWKNSLLRPGPDITIRDIHSWEASLKEAFEMQYRDALRRTLVNLTEGKVLKPKEFKALLIQLKKERFMGSRQYRNLRQNLHLENLPENKILPQYVTMAMVKKWEDTMSEQDKEIYSNKLKKFSKSLGTNSSNARLLKFRGKQYALAQDQKRHANPLTPAQKQEITTWIENLKLNEFPLEADDARSNELLSPEGVTMEMIRKWEARIRNGKHMNALKGQVNAWMADELPPLEIKDRSIRYRGQRYLESQKKNSRKRKREERRIAEAIGTQPPNTSRGNSATPPTMRTHTTEATPIHGEAPNTSNASPSIAKSALPVTQPAHSPMDADKHGLLPHPDYPHGTISLKDLEKGSKWTHK